MGEKGETGTGQKARSLVKTVSQGRLMAVNIFKNLTMDEEADTKDQLMNRHSGRGGGSGRELRQADSKDWSWGDFTPDFTRRKTASSKVFAQDNVEGTATTP